jgi:sulfur carrier protein ThiS
MRTRKITITKEDFNKSLREILIDLNINPETVLVKINKQFKPISTIITKETEIEVLEVIKI